MITVFLSFPLPRNNPICDDHSLPNFVQILIAPTAATASATSRLGPKKRQQQQQQRSIGSRLHFLYHPHGKNKKNIHTQMMP